MENSENYTLATPIKRRVKVITRIDGTCSRYVTDRNFYRWGMQQNDVTFLLRIVKRCRQEGYRISLSLQEC